MSEPSSATFKIAGSALDDLHVVADAMRIVERRLVSLEEALAHALLTVSEQLSATVIDPFQALLVGPQSLIPPATPA